MDGKHQRQIARTKRVFREVQNDYDVNVEKGIVVEEGLAGEVRTHVQGMGLLVILCICCTP